MRAPSGPAVGAYVYAKDKKGYWYRAKVLAERGGNPRSYFVHIQGFRSNHDEWVPKARIRLTATKAQIVQLNARVAWMGNTTGLNADENSWEIDEIFRVRSWAPSPIRKNSLQQHHPVWWLIIEKQHKSAPDVPAGSHRGTIRRKNDATG